MNNTELLKTVNDLIIDKHIITTCTDFISTCYNLFYDETSQDVTFILGSEEYTIPNVVKNEGLGVEPIQGEIDPEGFITGNFGQIYYNILSHKIFFKSTEEVDAVGWKLLFQRITESNEEDALDNVTKLIADTQEIITAYYNVFYNDTPMDVTLKLYNGAGVPEDITIPNRAKSMKVGKSGEGIPEGSVDGTYGTFYVNTLVNKVYVKSTPTGNTGWYELISAEELTAHNLSPIAHQGFLARLEGDRTRTFNVGNPTANTHAVNLGYTGALSDLNTINKSNLVSAINEINADLEVAKKQASVVSSSSPWCAISGYTDTEGRADLIIADRSQVIYEDNLTKEYTDNIVEGNWKDDFGSINNLYNWGNEGKVFGALLGTYFNGWSKVNGTDYTPQEDNVGYAGKPVVHNFEYALSPGTYIIAYSYAPYAYQFTLHYDDITYTQTVTNAVEGEWSFTDPITVTDGITAIEASGTATEGEWGIGPIHLIKVIPTWIANSIPYSTNKIYFKVGPNYTNISIADNYNNVTTRSSLAPIDLTNYGKTNTSERYGTGDYYVMYNNSKYNHNAFLLENATATEEGYAKLGVSGSARYIDVPCITLDAFEDGFSIEFTYTSQDTASEDTATVITSHPVQSDPATGFLQIVEEDGKLVANIGDTSTVSYSWDLMEIEESTDYVIRIVVDVSHKVKIYINGEDKTGNDNPTLNKDILEGFYFLSSYNTNFCSGGIHLNTVKIDYICDSNFDPGAGKTRHVLVDGSSTDPYLYKGSITRTKTNPNNEGIWENVSTIPIQIIDNQTGKEFKDIPIARVTLQAGDPLSSLDEEAYITQVKTLPYCNREVDTPTSVAPAYVVETSTSSTSWYRLWSNGFCEQGGIASVTTAGTTINLLKAYKDTYYTITLTPSSGTVTAGAQIYTNSFTIYPTANNNCRWVTEGFVPNIVGYVESEQ